MNDSPDTEITVSTGKMLMVFFAFVVVCALFFGMGFTLGKNATVSASTTASVPAASATDKTAADSASEPPLTFYKTVEQKDANAKLTQPDLPSSESPAPSAQPHPEIARATTPAPAPAPSTAAPTPTAAAPSGIVVQVAAVTRSEDAAALANALKRKDYGAFVASVPTDKLFRVQIGPFSDLKAAEATKNKLVSDGYNSIVKK